MLDNTVPVFEAKNRLSFYLHKADTEGPVFITSRGKKAYVIQSIGDYETQKSEEKKESIFDRAAELRKKYGLENDDFDYTAYYESIRERGYYGPSDSEHIFDGV